MTSGCNRSLASDAPSRAEIFPLRGSRIPVVLKQEFSFEAGHRSAESALRRIDLVRRTARMSAEQSHQSTLALARTVSMSIRFFDHA
jgi:hypothetical protein